MARKMKTYTFNYELEQTTKTDVKKDGFNE